MAEQIEIHVGCSASISRHFLHLWNKERGERIGWITPSHRSALATRAELSGTYLQPLLGTAEQFALDLIRRAGPSFRPLNELQRRLLIEDILPRLAREGRLPTYEQVVESRGFVDAVAGMIEELKQAEITAGQLEEAVQELHEAEPESPLTRKARQWSAIYAVYADRLARRRLFDRDDLPSIAARLAQLAGANLRISTLLIQLAPTQSIGERRFLLALAREVPRIFVGTNNSEDRFLVALRELGEPTTIEHPLPNDRPIGMQTIHQQLFHPRPVTERVGTVTGVHLIQAPGEVGEARMIARSIRELLRSGTKPEEIVVTARDSEHTGELLCEAFDEFEIPLDAAGVRPLANSPVIATLIRAFRLAEEDFPFSGVAALLRNSHFRPEPLEGVWDRQTPLDAEVLLRRIGEARGRANYLAAVRRWAEAPPDALEDEDAEVSFRQRTHELAKACLDFLEWFFRLWDPLPINGSGREYTDWLFYFADSVRLAQSDGLTERERLTWNRFRRELERWCLDQPEGESLTRARFARILSILAYSFGPARTPRGPGRVRFVSPEEAINLNCSHLFVIGLGETSFPNLAAPNSLLDDTIRGFLAAKSEGFPNADERLASERRLFRELCIRPTQELTLSYPAVDAKGQELLPSSFLLAVEECFAKNSLPTERRRMLIEGYFQDQPFAVSEWRVQFAEHLHRSRGPIPFVPPASQSLMIQNLLAAKKTAEARFQSIEWSVYDGLITEPAIIRCLADRFHSDYTFSPTALENYIACPFRFFLQNVMRLETPDDPKEEIELTRRGAAFHRALARFHTKEAENESTLDEAGEEAVHNELSREVLQAIGEYRDRAESPAAKMLWELEGRRLLRSVKLYPAAWLAFRKDWEKHGVRPRPALLEAGFGFGSEAAPRLRIEHSGETVYIGGRIDRVDTAPLRDGSIGFWVIDYKTGRGNSYSATKVRELEKLQLPLYALAVEELWGRDRILRPLGLLYWMLTDHAQSLKIMAPQGRGESARLDWLMKPQEWRKLRAQLQAHIIRHVQAIRGGGFRLAPRDKNCTGSCPYGSICRINQSRHVGKQWRLELPQVSEAVSPTAVMEDRR